MALTREQKATQLQEIKEKMQKSESVIFASYIGLTVADVTQFRGKLREGGAEMKVAKKTLMRIAAKDLDMPELTDESLPGPVACIFSYKDPVGGPQAALKFMKDHPQVSFLGGIFDGKLLTKDQAKAMASIPTRPVLLAIFAGMLRSPLTKFAHHLNAPTSSFARALSEMAKKKAATAA